MERENYLNFDKPFLDKPVYRYMKLDKFFMLFDESQNVLCQPRKWDDPFENFILNAQVQGSDGKLENFGVRDQVYGQCWTLERRSDALWRIFCGKGQGVRIRSTLRKLGATLSRNLSHAGRYHAFIGRVEYLSDKKLFGRARSISMDCFDPEKIARSLLMKRNAFRHEAEVRIVYRMMSDEPYGDGLFRYPIDPHKLIEQVMIDPRFQPGEVSELKQKIKNRTGYKGNLRYSLLYSKPKGFVITTPYSGSRALGPSSPTCAESGIHTRHEG
jgi:hypothetical protein